MIELVQGNITELDVDAIVNAANSSLQLGGGVAGAICRKGGPSIQQECDKIGYCPVGGSVITGGGKLKARHVIHAVGPMWGEGNEDEKLTSAITNSLKLSEEKGIKTIAFPAISTGIFGFPKERAAKVILQAAKRYLKEKHTLRKIIFCLWDQETYEIFKKTADWIEQS